MAGEGASLMAQFPAMPLWTDAYLGDTHHLSTTEHGAYLLLLITMWRNKGWLPNDDRALARYAKLTNAQWARIKPNLWPYFVENGDRITQGRLTDEIEVVKRNSRKQSDKAKTRWLKEKENGNAVASPGNAGTMPPSPSPTPTLKKEPISSSPKKEPNGCRLPENFSPDMDFAIAEGLQPQDAIVEVAKFRDYWKSKAGQAGRKTDWPATWRNWVRKAIEDRSKFRASSRQRPMTPLEKATRYAMEPDYDAPQRNYDGNYQIAERLPVSGKRD
jgi:uncharacterized protein YdaU (DUF1376 family)